ncbi:glucosamine inositolphosphorylceramide transferase family protein [Bradyrhizobium sp. PMVTL-01]|uniref:glucosamine inositolphosphorylceramide transferase family protein n=1 Tax=Bradyrhizobium sp. PMVTL-01 TaxID=3434999 RepID=UPI003F70CF98
MIIEFRCEIEHARRWMDRETLSIDGRDVPVQIAWTATAEPRFAGLDMLFELERIVLHKGKHGAASRLKIIPERTQTRTGTADVIVDFTGGVRDPNCPARLYLRPRFNGVSGENAALAAILAGDLPVIEIVNEVDGAILDRGHPSGEMAAGLSGALETVMARTMTMVTAILSGRPRIVPQLAHPATTTSQRGPAGYVARGLAMSIAKEIYRLCCYAPHWHVGWRFNDDAGVWQTGDLSGPGWNVLGDPGNHFYADPFPITWRGRTFVFFEDLDHRVGKGIISAIEFGDSGPIGEVMPVLEEPWHLSYPFLIEDGGELWMIPESSLNGDVALYKCVRFPDKWERHATLLSGLELADATITRHNGLSYLFGAWRDGTGGYSDSLAIYYAEHLLGPWRPHASNPVMIDRASARPAGNFVTIDRKLWRPVQDCAEAYGAGLALAEIIELSPTTFKQIVRRSLKPGPLWPGRKLHTLNRCGRLEVIDGSRVQPKTRAFVPSRAHSSPERERRSIRAGFVADR